MSLSNFNDFALTRSEMKNVVGGSVTCTIHYPGGHTQGTCAYKSVYKCEQQKIPGAKVGRCWW